MRGSELYRRYIDRITAIARAPDSSADWKGSVETAVRQLHAETMALMRAPFRELQDDLAAELESKARSQTDGPAHDVFTLASELIRKL